MREEVIRHQSRVTQSPSPTQGNQLSSQAFDKKSKAFSPNARQPIIQLSLESDQVGTEFV